MTSGIANQVYLEPIEIDALERALDDLNLLCLGGALYNTLQWTNVGINFKIGYTAGFPAGYDPATNTITFRDAT